MADYREQNEHYAEIGAELIEEMPELEELRDSGLTICYLSSEHEKKSGGKVIYGQCEHVPDKYKWGIPCDYTITLFEPNIAGMTEDQIKILIFHELLHVNPEGSGCRPHDLEDFKVIIDRYGTDWAAH